MNALDKLWILTKASMMVVVTLSCITISFGILQGLFDWWDK